MSTPNVTYDLVTEPRRGYLFARLRTVSLTADVVRQLVQELRTAILAARRSRLLLEYEVAFTQTDDEALEFMSKMMEALGTRIALVAADTKHAASLHFGAAVAGFDREDIRFFTGTGPAEEWLLDESA